MVMMILMPILIKIMHQRFAMHKIYQKGMHLAKILNGRRTIDMAVGAQIVEHTLIIARMRRL